MSARSASRGPASSGPMSQISPVPWQFPGVKSGGFQTGLDRRGGAELLAGELGVHVQVTTEVDELGEELVGQDAGRGQ